jgi:tellurite resistance protein TerC
VFAITRDPFIVYTSNICAILGLRSLYFLVAKMITRFVYLKSGLAIVLAFVGAKMMLRDVFEIPTLLSLAFVIGVLAATICISMAATRKEARQTDSTP